MKIQAVTYPLNAKPEERTRKFALRQLGQFIRLVEMVEGGREEAVVEISERDGKLQMYICPNDRIFQNVENYSAYKIVDKSFIP